MKKSDFWYDLPQELIAQDPLEKRENSRLMVLDRAAGSVSHRHFFDITDLLRPGDCLVLNNSKVMPARVFGTKKTGARVEFLLLKNLGDDCWECITGPGRKAREGDEFTFGEGEMTCVVTGVLENGNRTAKFSYDAPNIFEVLDKIGIMPLPHYITHELKDKDRYQTVYADPVGSAAAPTAGLHFTLDLLDKIREKGVKTAYVTLHVGIGTFRPVKTENIEDHLMHTESYLIPEEAADTINATRKEGGRIIAVGTTSCRTLESAADENGFVAPGASSTGIFIYPGYSFRCVDSLITNFHLPESTLIMLVSAFYSREKILEAYNEAIKERYRFFSFGDAMMIV